MYMVLLKTSDAKGYRPVNPLSGEVGIEIKYALVFRDDDLDDLQKWADSMVSKGFKCKIVEDRNGSFRTVYSGKTRNKLNLNTLDVRNDIGIFAPDLFDMVGEEFIIMDTETTGLNIETSDAIEVGGIKVRVCAEGMQIIDDIDLYINPGYPLPQAILDFNLKNNTGITQEKISNSLGSVAAANMLAEFIGGTETLVFHNAEFDLQYIDKLLSHNTVIDKLDVRAYCTLNFSRQIIKGSHKLSNLHAKTPKTHYNEMIQNNVYHNAVADIYATLDVLEWLLKVNKNI